MPDNTQLDLGSGGDKVATDELTYSGETAKVALERPVHITGAEGAKTLHEILFAEDAAHTTGDYGPQPLTVRQDTAAALGGTDGDYQPFITDANGRLHTLDQNSAALLADTAAMDTNLGTVAGDTTSIDTKLPTFSTDTGGMDANTIRVAIANDNDTLSVSNTTNPNDDQENAAAGTVVGLVGGRYDVSPRTLGNGDAGAIALDADGAVHVSDGGNTLTVDGTVTANLGATDNGVLDSIATNTGNTDTNTTDIPNVIGTNGVPGPTNVLSVGGTDSIGNIEELLTDSGRLQVDIVSGAGGTQYTEADIDGTITGTALMFEDTGNTLRAATGDTTNGLDVDVTRVSGTVTVDGSGVTQPISGTITANLSATDNAVLDTIETNTDYGTVTGGGVEASALRVTLANDSTGQVTVDGTVTANAGTGTMTVTDDGSFTLAANSGVDIGDVDVTSITPGIGATNLGKAIDAPAGATDVGITSLAIRDDTLTTLTPVDGDYVPLRVNSTGALHVTGGGGGTEYTDDTSTHTSGSTVGGAIMAVAAPTDTTLDANDMGVPAMNTSRAIHVSIQEDSVGIGGGQANTISTNNSTTATLGIGAAFTGTGDDVSAYQAVTIQLDSDVDSATDGMTFQFSSDNTNWDDIYTFTYTAANGSRRFQFPTTAQYFRVVYTNGGTGQAHFRVQTILHGSTVLTSIHRLADNMSPDRSASVSKAVLFAQAGGSGDFIAIDASASGKLQVASDTDLAAINGNTVDIGNGSADTATLRVAIADDNSNVPVAVNSNPSDDQENGPAGTIVTTVAGRYDATPRTLGDGDAGAIALDADGAVQVSDGGNALTVDGTVTETNSAGILSDTSSMDTSLANLAGTVSGTELQVDVITSDLPTGAATAANQLPDGHAVTIDNASGASAVNIQDGGNAITVDNGGTFAVQSAGDVAHDSADSGNPVKIGAKATDSVEGLTQVAANDRTDLRADLNGCLITRNATTLEELVSTSQSVTTTTSTAATNFGAGGANIHNYVTSVTIHNSSATDSSVDLQDGSGGTTRWHFPAPAAGGTTHNFNPPLKQTTANTALYFAAADAVSTMYISINGFQAKG